MGRTMRRLAPAHDAHWFEIYGKVARTGEAVRFVNEATALGGRWFDVAAYRVGEPGQWKVAICFHRHAPSARRAGGGKGAARSSSGTSARSRPACTRPTMCTRSCAASWLEEARNLIGARAGRDQHGPGSELSPSPSTSSRRPRARPFISASTRFDAPTLYDLVNAEAEPVRVARATWITTRGAGGQAGKGRIGGPRPEAGGLPSRSSAATAREWACFSSRARWPESSRRMTRPSLSSSPPCHHCRREREVLRELRGNDRARTSSWPCSPTS